MKTKCCMRNCFIHSFPPIYVYIYKHQYFEKLEFVKWQIDMEQVFCFYKYFFPQIYIYDHCNILFEVLHSKHGAVLYSIAKCIYLLTNVIQSTCHKTRASLFSSKEQYNFLGKSFLIEEKLFHQISLKNHIYFWTQ